MPRQHCTSLYPDFPGVRVATSSLSPSSFIPPSPFIANHTGNRVATGALCPHTRRRNCKARGQLSAGTSRPGNRCSGSRPGGSSSVYRVTPRDQPRRRKKQMKTARKARNNTITVTGSEGRRKVKFARNRNIVKCQVYKVLTSWSRFQKRVRSIDIDRALEPFTLPRACPVVGWCAVCGSKSPSVPPAPPAPRSPPSGQSGKPASFPSSFIPPPSFIAKHIGNLHRQTHRQPYRHLREELHGAGPNKSSPVHRGHPSVQAKSKRRGSQLGKLGKLRRS